MRGAIADHRAEGIKLRHTHDIEQSRDDGRGAPMSRQNSMRNTSATEREAMGDRHNTVLTRALERSYSRFCRSLITDSDQLAPSRPTAAPGWRGEAEVVSRYLVTNPVWRQLAGQAMRA